MQKKNKQTNTQTTISTEKRQRKRKYKKFIDVFYKLNLASKTIEVGLCFLDLGEVKGHILSENGCLRSNFLLKVDVLRQ